MAKTTAKVRRLEPQELQGTQWAWRLGGLRVGELLKRVAADSGRDRVFGWAAQLSFYFLLALFPLLIFVSSLAGILLSADRHLLDRALAYLEPAMPTAGAELLRSILQEVLSDSSQAGLGLGLLFTVWSASYGMEAIIDGMNAAFDVREFRAWWRRRLLAIGMTVLVGIALLLVLAGIVLGGAVSSALAAWIGLSGLGWVWRVVEWTIVLVFLFGVVSLIYMYAPNLRYQPWVATVPGTIVALAIWIAASVAFRFYVDQFFGSYVSMYGSLGAGVVVLLWLYVSSAALLIGAEVNSEIRWAASNAGSPEARASLQQGTDA